MIVIDIGNTKTILGYVRDGKIQKTWKMATHKNMLADEYIAHFNQFLSQIQTSWESNPVCMASVVPHITEQLRNATAKRSDVHFVHHESPLHFLIHLPNPRSLGADLIAAAEGAVSKYKPPMIIVDAGTATTITVIDREKKFIGGAICPGVGISSQALFSNASALSPLPLELPKQVIGNQTNSAILSGICLGHASMIEKMIERFEKEIGETCSVIMTGGAMDMLMPALPSRYTLDATLTLDGLISIQQNSARVLS